MDINPTIACAHTHRNSHRGMGTDFSKLCIHSIKCLDVVFMICDSLCILTPTLPEHALTHLG